MKINPDMCIEDVLKEVLASDSQVTAVGREMSAVESAEATVALKSAFEDHMNKVRTLCIGCGQDAPLFKTKACVCGGFVCESCERIDTDGECTHERPAFLPAKDDDAD